MVMAVETVRQGQATEFLDHWRCEACIRNDRKCWIQESLDECFFCEFAKEPCIFKRTVTRVGPRKEYSWAELVGSGNSSQDSPATQTSFSPPESFRRPSISQKHGSDRLEPIDRPSTAIRLPPLRRSSPPFQGRPNGSPQTQSLAPLNSILGANPPPHGLPILPGQGPPLPTSNPINLVTRTNAVGTNGMPSSPPYRGNTSVPSGYGKPINGNSRDLFTQFSPSKISQKRRIPLEFISDIVSNTSEDSNPKSLKRIDPISEPSQLKVPSVNPVKACWRCMILKRECDTVDPCDPCRRKSTITLDRPNCHRGSLKDWLPKLFAGASHGTLSTSRGMDLFREVLHESGHQFLAKARESKSPPDQDLVPLSSVFDDRNNKIDLDQTRKLLIWLESVYFNNQSSHFPSAYTALCTLMLAVRAFAESYCLAFHHGMHPQSPSILPSEIVIQTANFALEALFSLVKMREGYCYQTPTTTEIIGIATDGRANRRIDTESLNNQMDAGRRESMRDITEESLYKATEMAFFGNRRLNQAKEANGPSAMGQRPRHLATFSAEMTSPMSPQSQSTVTFGEQQPASQTSLPVVQYEPLPDMGENVLYTSFEIPGEGPDLGHIILEEQLDPMEALKCQVCGNVSRNRSENNKHKLRHDKPFTCTMEGCNRTSGFTTQNDLDRHIKSIHGVLYQGRTFQCAAPHCAKATKMWPRADNFRQHCQRLHKDTDLNELMDKSLDRAMKTMEKSGAIPLHLAGQTFSDPRMAQAVAAAKSPINSDSDKSQH